MEFKKQRVVVKVGTSTITHPSGAPNLRNIEILARTLSDLQDMGHEMILVSSGAIAVGTDKLGLAERPRELRFKQAAASVGQCRLMFTYDKFFSEYGHTVGQILLTDDDVADPSRAAHLEATFSALSEMGVIPIVNENDSVSSAEIELPDKSPDTPSVHLKAARHYSPKRCYKIQLPAHPYFPLQTPSQSVLLHKGKIPVLLSGKSRSSEVLLHKVHKTG